MDDLQNKNQSTGSTSSFPNGSSNNKTNEEKELLKEAKILIRDEEGKFKYLKGESLLGEEARKISAKPLVIPKEAIKTVTASKVHAPLLELKKPSDKLTASFYFDAEDEEEIQKIHEERIGKAAPVINYESIVQEIRQATGINLPDELLQKRFSSLITSRLRDIRNSYQLKELLTRTKKVGGLELPPEKADEIIEITEEKAKTIHDQNTIKELEEHQKIKAEEEKKRQEEQQKLRQAIAREQIKKAVQTMQEKAAPATAPPLPSAPKKEIRRTIPIIPQVKRPIPEMPSKTKIVDIRTPSRLLGPIEEIRTLNLNDFRRLNSNPFEAVKKIKEKIELLEEESFTKKAEGIQAWKQSEVCQLYLDIGNESMNKGKTVREIINSRTMESRSFLTQEEFEAVGDLNKQLRF